MFQMGRTSRGARVIHRMGEEPSGCVYLTIVDLAWLVANPVTPSSASSCPTLGQTKIIATAQLNLTRNGSDKVIVWPTPLGRVNLVNNGFIKKR